MKKIRKGVFETNSSSTHSITLGKDKSFIMDNILPDKNGVITLIGGQFGWEYKKTNKAIDKANYAAVALRDSKLLVDVIKEHTQCEKLIIQASDDYDSPNWSYIDHQSIGTCPNNKEDLKHFLFNKNAWLFGGNDNSQAPHGYYDVEIYDKSGITNTDFKYEFKVEKYPELNIKSKNKFTLESIQNHLESLNFRIFMEPANVISFDGNKLVNKYYKVGDIELNPSSWSNEKYYELIDWYIDQECVQDGKIILVSNQFESDSHYTEQNAERKLFYNDIKNQLILDYEIMEL